MDPDLLALLRKVDTPVVCDAIEVVEGRRGFAAYTRHTMLCSAPEAGAVVGFARTAKIAAAAPSPDPADVVRQRRMDYYRYMAESPAPAVAVLEDVDHPACAGAYWGELNASIHRGFGLAGAITNGVMRDLGELPRDFPLLAGSVLPSHAFVHVREIDTPVEIFGLAVRPGDLIHADRHGAIVVPPAVLPDLAAAIPKLIDTEKIVLDVARAPGLDFARFEAAWTAFEKART